jgi:hypothetical protein
MKTIQLHIPDDLAEKVLRLSSNAESFILDLIRSRFSESDKPSILANEYRMASVENSHISADFAHTDMEGWDDEY